MLALCAIDLHDEQIFAAGNQPLLCRLIAVFIQTRSGGECTQPWSNKAREPKTLPTDVFFKNPAAKTSRSMTGGDNQEGTKETTTPMTTDK